MTEKRSLLQVVLEQTESLESDVAIQALNALEETHFEDDGTLLGVCRYFRRREGEIEDQIQNLKQILHRTKKTHKKLEKERGERKIPAESSY